MKRFLMMAALFAASLFFASCNHPVIVPDDEGRDDKPAEAIALTRAEEGINAGANAFGLNVFRTINASDKIDDLFISPLSLSLAFAMAAEGAP